MSEYSVMLEVFASTSVTVDADSVEEAMALAALEASTSICHHCSRKLNVSDVGEVLEVLGPDNEIAWSRPEDKRVADLEMQNAMLKKGMDLVNAELTEAVELLKVSTALLECNAQPIDKPSIEANTAFLARHGGQP